MNGAVYIYVLVEVVDFFPLSPSCRNMTGSKSGIDGIESHVVKRYEIQKRLGKGVSII